jgi:DNA topoisomerase IB
LSAISLMAATPLPDGVNGSASERAFKAAIVAAIRAVAEELRNTPTVARKSYINPIVFAAWRSGSLHRTVTGDLKGAPRKAEKIALAFLRSESRRAKRAAKQAARPDALERALKKSIAATRRTSER